MNDADFVENCLRGNHPRLDHRDKPVVKNRAKHDHEHQGNKYTDTFERHTHFICYTSLKIVIIDSQLYTGLSK